MIRTIIDTMCPGCNREMTLRTKYDNGYYQCSYCGNQKDKFPLKPLVFEYDSTGKLIVTRKELNDWAARIASYVFRLRAKRYRRDTGYLFHTNEPLNLQYRNIVRDKINNYFMRNIGIVPFKFKFINNDSFCGLKVDIIIKEHAETNSRYYTPSDLPPF